MYDFYLFLPFTKYEDLNADLRSTWSNMQRFKKNKKIFKFLLNMLINMKRDKCFFHVSFVIATHFNMVAIFDNIPARWCQRSSSSPRLWPSSIFRAGARRPAGAEACLPHGRALLTSLLFLLLLVVYTFNTRLLWHHHHLAYSGRGMISASWRVLQ